MASLLGQDGLFSHLMNFNPQGILKEPLSATADAPRGLAETLEFGANPGNLRMLSYVPEALSPGAPLVVVLHGCTQTAAEYDRGAGWSTLAERFGFAVLFPEQKRANNGNSCFDWFQPDDVTRGRGEVASIAAMVTAMVETHELNRQRVYVTGLSAGGAMTAALLATYPDLFAGGAIIAGLPFGSAASVPEAFGVMGQGRIRSARELGDRVRAASEHQGRWPTVAIWQGTADTTVNPVNAEELRKQWAAVHGVTDAAPEEGMLDGAVHRVWRGENGKPVLETVTVPGLGHATPIDADALDEDARCGNGAASRFIVQAGISSSYRIAESWGLIGRRRTVRQGTTGRATPHHAPAWQDFLPGGVENVQHMATQLADAHPLIGKVLRSAGLMNGRRKD